MSDTPEKVIHDLWAAELDSVLSSESVFTVAPENEEQPLPYACVDIQRTNSVETSGSGYDEADLTLEVYHRNWKQGLRVVTEFRKALRGESFSGEGIKLDGFKLETADPAEKQEDDSWVFRHTYSLRISENG